MIQRFIVREHPFCIIGDIHALTISDKKTYNDTV